MLHSAQLLVSCALFITCAATPLMLTVQTQSQQHMLKLTAQDTQHRLLGAMEATQSSVVRQPSPISERCTSSRMQYSGP